MKKVTKWLFHILQRLMSNINQKEFRVTID